MMQTLHFRIWRGRTARTACKTGGTSTPDKTKVNCLQCKAIMANPETAEAAPNPR